MNFRIGCQRKLKILGLRQICSLPKEKASANKSPNLRSCRLLRSIAAVIVIFLAVCGTASAFGLNVFQAVAEWTADTFHFVAGSGQNSSQLDPYSELRAVVGDKTDVTVVPNWAPEGTALKESISVADCSNGVRIQSVYESISGSFRFVYIYISMRQMISLGCIKRYRKCTIVQFWRDNALFLS